MQDFPKHTVHQPISRKQRLLQELHNTPSLPDQQKSSTHIPTIDQQSTKPKVGLHVYIFFMKPIHYYVLFVLIKEDKSILLSNKLDCIKVDDKSTAKDMFCQIINESLMDNTSPLPSQFTTNNFYKYVCRLVLFYKY